jgi:hypothetical protein
MAKINSTSIIRKATDAIRNGAKEKEIRSFLNDKALSAATEISKNLQSEFDTHKVTSELRGGATGISYVEGMPKAPLGGKYGNIAAFFGLTDNKIASDLSIVRAILSRFTVKVTRKAAATYEISVSFPKEKEFYDVTPPPSDSYSVSWLKALELGLLQNFSHFLFRLRGLNSSRTGVAIQVENKLRGDQQMPAVPYISSIYEKVLGAGEKSKQLLGNYIQKRFKV